MSRIKRELRTYFDPIRKDDWILGERDEKGFCELIINGEPTDTRMLVFSPDQVSEIREWQIKEYGHTLD
jgi:hypothetical protein